MPFIHICFLIFTSFFIEVESGKINDPFNFFCGSENCYDILGLQRNSTSVDIKRAFRKGSIKYHPDKNKEPEALEMFRLVTKANEVLSDEKKRELFDYYLDHPRCFSKLICFYRLF